MLMSFLFNYLCVYAGQGRYMFVMEPGPTSEQGFKRKVRFSIPKPNYEHMIPILWSIHLTLDCLYAEDKLERATSTCGNINFGCVHGRSSLIYVILSFVVQVDVVTVFYCFLTCVYDVLCRDFLNTET
ncbi:uncharacterized protein [Apostichopus japonicus]|uniref:uncharacterized protein n=1 Tax=Stichopus japonicus TaxID=307972 RepID=UPI003AB20F1D